MNHTRQTARYGWVPDLPDARDIRKLVASPAVLPAHVDMRSACPPVYDQGDLGSCTANAIAAAVDFARGKQGMPFITPSRLFIYYRERAIEGTVNEDSGAMIRDGMQSCAVKGVCPEADWPYDIGKFTVQPPKQAYHDAWHNIISVYERLDNTSLAALQAVLAAGEAFVFGFTVYESFESTAVAKTGVVRMPLRSERVLGGHAVLAVGYDDATRRFIVRNSWGNGWGQVGYFTMPYAYLTDPNLADDFWCVQAEKQR